MPPRRASPNQNEESREEGGRRRGWRRPTDGRLAKTPRHHSGSLQGMQAGEFGDLAQRFNGVLRCAGKKVEAEVENAELKISDSSLLAHR